MLRFDLEKLLISGNLNVNDVEGAWNERFESDFGYKVERPSQGVLQDVHWAAELSAIFHLYPRQRLRRMPISKNEKFNLQSRFTLSNGDLSSATEWA